MNDRAALEAIAGGCCIGEPLGDEAVGGPFGDGDRLLALGEQPDDGVLQLIIFFAEHEHAERFVDFVDGRFHRFAASGFGGAAGGDAERDGRVADGDADARLAAAADHVGEHRFEVALADAEAFDAAMTRDALCWLGGGDCRGDGVRPHGEHLGRHAGEGEDAAWRAAVAWDRSCRCRGGAVGIGNRPAAARELGLQGVALRHRAGAAGEEFADVLECRIVLDEVDAGGGGDRFAGEIVGRGAEAAGGDDEIGPVDRGSEDGDVVRRGRRRRWCGRRRRRRAR